MNDGGREGGREGMVTGRQSDGETEMKLCCIGRRREEAGVCVSHCAISVQFEFLW